MSLELASIPLAWVAGVLSILSPCVWPLVPIIMASAAGKGRWGPLYLALGLSLSFALAGSLLTFILLNLGLNPVAFRWLAAVLLVVIGLILVIKPLAEWVSLRLSLISGRMNMGNADSRSAPGQFGVGLLLGFVWLPCVGPTLGVAIALASLGQDLVMAFVVMFTFGIGTSSALIAAALLSKRLLCAWRPNVFNNVGIAKLILGWLLLFMGMMVLTGLDKVLETYVVQYLPDWAISL